MASMKLEYLHQTRGKRTLGERGFGQFHRAVNFLRFRGIINPLLGLGITKKLMGIATERSMPKLASPAYMKAYLSGHTVDAAKGAERPVILWVDEFTQAQEPLLVGKALDILEVLGWTPVVLAEPSGRALLSGGLLPEAKELAEKTVSALKHASDTLGEVPIIGLEASAVLSAKDEYLRLLDGPELAWISEQQWSTIDEFLANEGPKLDRPQQHFSPYTDEVLIHVHCHQKSLESAGSTAYALQLLLGAKANRVKSSCCGMAGGYGMKAVNYSMSTKMASLVLLWSRSCKS